MDADLQVTLIARYAGLLDMEEELEDADPLVFRGDRNETAKCSHTLNRQSHYPV